MNIFVVTICQRYLPNRVTVNLKRSMYSIIDESQAENRPVPIQEAEIRQKKVSFVDRYACCA